MITSPTDHLLVEQDGHVVTVTMNRPDKRNAWSGDMIHGMAEVWDAIDDDDTSASRSSPAPAGTSAPARTSPR
jgi:enoyl-CoA hydratase/carnithine racemase